MSNTDFPANIRIGATDDSASVIQDWARRMRDTARQVQESLKGGVSNELDNVTKKMEQVHKGAREHMERGFGQSFERAGDKVLDFVKDFAGVAAVEETLRRSYDSFAKFQRGMEMISFASHGTAEEVHEVGEKLEEIVKRTGVSVEQLQDSFQSFMAMSGLELAPAIKAFDEVAAAAKVTGTSIDDMARLTSTAINNLKVPIEQIPGMLDAWVTVIPPKMMAPFAAVAPRLTATLASLGLTGKNAGLELATAFVEMEKALGQPRLAAVALTDVLTRVANMRDPLGQMMLPMIEQIYNAGGGPLEVLEALYERLESLHMLGADPKSRAILRGMLNIDEATLRGLIVVHDHIDKIREEMKRTGESMGEVVRRTNLLAGEPLGAINRLFGAIESLGVSTGKLLDALGASAVLRQIVQLFEAWAAATDKITTGVEKTKKLLGLSPEDFAEHPEWDKQLRDNTNTLRERWQKEDTERQNRPGLGAYQGAPATQWHDHPAFRATTPEVKENTEALKDLNNTIRGRREGLIHKQAFTPGAGEPPWSQDAMVPISYTPGGGSAFGGYDTRGLGGGGSYGGGGGPRSGGGGSGGVMPPVTAGPGEGAGGGASTLAEARARYADELNDPNIVSRLAALTEAEVGGQGPRARQAFIETVLNRAAARNQTLDQTLRPGYYPGMGRVGSVSEKMRQQTIGNIDQALKGSNLAAYGTGNASGSVGFAGGPQTANFGTGERFGIEGPDRAWARRMMAGAAGGSATAGDDQFFPASGDISPHGNWGAPRRGGRQHAGLDIGGKEGSPIFATAGGKVLSSQWHNGYGWTVDVQRSDGTVDRYGHLQGFNVKPGDTVSAGQTIAGMGHTGNAGSFTHLHYEHRQDAGYGHQGTFDPGAELGVRPGSHMVGGTAVHSAYAGAPGRGAGAHSAAAFGPSALSGRAGGARHIGQERTEQHHIEQIRKELERPIKVNLEAPTYGPDSSSVRRAFGRRLIRQDSEDNWSNARYRDARADLGYA